jgi:hypothetical protein
MAYSNNILGPYILFENGVLSLNDTYGNGHIASPDVIIKDNKFILYYHTIYNSEYNSQSTFIAESNDGLKFISTEINISHPYFRYFEYESEIYGIVMENHIKLINNKLYIFYSIVGDCPEHIYVSELIKDNNKFYILEKNSLINPTLEYEHNNLIPIKSEYGGVYKSINQLRDPYVYIEDDDIYILYTVCGEQGIAIAQLYIIS